MKIIVWGLTKGSKYIQTFSDVLGIDIPAVFDDSGVSVSPFGGTPKYVGKSGLATWKATTNLSSETHYFIVTIEDGQTRYNKFVSLEKESGLNPISLIYDPKSNLATNVTADSGLILSQGSRISTGTTIGKACIIGLNSTVGASCIIGNGVTIGHGVIIGDGSRVSDYCSLKDGSVVGPGKIVGKSCTINSGAIVSTNLDANKTLSPPPSLVST